MGSVRDPVARSALIARVKSLTPASQRLWGRMHLTQMLAHTADQIRMALGEVEAEGVRGPFRFAPMRFLLLHVLPWPKAKAKAPHEAFTTPPTELESDRATLVGLIERFAATPPSDLTPTHPLFGTMSARDWDALTHKHLDHHLRQFSA